MRRPAPQTPTASAPTPSSLNELKDAAERRLSQLQAALDGLADLCRDADSETPPPNILYNFGALARALAEQADLCLRDLDAFAVKAGVR